MMKEIIIIQEVFSMERMVYMVSRTKDLISDSNLYVLAGNVFFTLLREAL